MHTRHSVRWMSSVAALAAGLIGLGVPLAAPAAAATGLTLSATPAQPRYQAGNGNVATINVTANPATAGPITATVTAGPDSGEGPTPCTVVGTAPSTSWRCTITNGGGTGTDTVTISDTVAPVSTTTANVSWLTIAAVPTQNVGGPPPNADYLYGTGETATISVAVAGMNASNPAVIKGIIAPGGVDAPGAAATPISCTQSAGTANYSCSFTNNGNAGSDLVTIFDDANPNGTPGAPDAGEPAAAPFTVNFEKVTAAPSAAPNQPNQQTYTVNVTGIPAGHNPDIKETIVSGADSAAPGCTPSPGPATWTCTINNGGRPDNPTIRFFDDLNSDGVASATEPSTTVTDSFETLSATDPTATAANPNGTHVQGSTATINVTVSGSPAGRSPSVDYQIINKAAPAPASPDNTSAAPGAAGPVVLCSGAGSSWTCSVRNASNLAGTDTLRIFDDANANGAYDVGEPVTTIDVAFGTTVTATPASQSNPIWQANVPTSGLANVAVTVTAPANEVPHVRYTVTQGPDADASHTSVPCSPQNGGTTQWVCTVKNGPINANGQATGPGRPGLDTVTIYDDKAFQQFGANETAGQAAFSSASDPSSVVKADWVAASGLTLTPVLAPNQTQARIVTGGCQAYDIDVIPASSYPVTVTASYTYPSGTTASGGIGGIGGSNPPAVLGVCNVPGGSTVTVTSNTVSGGGTPIIAPAPFTDTMVVNTSTGQNPAQPGRAIIGLTSSATGTVVVNASGGGQNAPPSSFLVGTGGQSTIKNLSVTPTTQSTSSGGTATYSVLAQDASFTPIPGGTIDYVIASGNPDATTAPVACPATNQNGTTTCTVKNAGAVGTDNLTFFAPQASGETAPGSGDPKATATLTVTNPVPAGSHLTVLCADQLASDANAPLTNCTVSTGNGGSKSVPFAAHVTDASGVPLQNVPVQFAIVSGSTTATSSTGNVTTNSSGNAIYVVTEPNPANNEKITIQATVGNPAQGGLGPVVASATFQTPKPTTLSVTPASQQIASGGTARFTAKVVDQFGAGVAGQSIGYSASGRNSASGIATTDSTGSAAFSYVDRGGSGPDTVTVTDTSSNAPSSGNPSTVSVSYGSGGGGGGGGGGGCTGVCSGTEHPSLRVTQTALGGGRTRLSLKVASHPSLANATVTFYQIRRGVRHVIGTGHTGGRGNVTGTLRARRGQHLVFQAKVNGKAGVSSGFSNRVTITVH